MLLANAFLYFNVARLLVYGVYEAACAHTKEGSCQRKYKPAVQLQKMQPVSEEKALGYPESIPAAAD